MPDRVLSQQEIDRVFRNLQNANRQEDLAKRAQPYDFRRPDRIAKDQLRSIHMLHESFARSLGSSLSAYLRAYVMVNLISVEQLSFMEFSQCLPSPTCIVSLGMRHYDNSALLELNPALVFPVLEMLLGGTGQSTVKLDREVTEIERSILDGLFRIVLKDLKEAWRVVAPQMDFQIESWETEPQLLQILSPNEAVVAVSMEVRIGEISGMMNIGVPSIVIKMLGARLEQSWTSRRTELTDVEHARILKLIRPAEVRVDTRLTGPTLSMENLLTLDVGDVLTFDYPITRPLQVSFNGRPKFFARIATTGRKRAAQLTQHYRPRE